MGGLLGCDLANGGVERDLGDRTFISTLLSSDKESLFLLLLELERESWVN